MVGDVAGDGAAGSGVCVLAWVWAFACACMAVVPSDIEIAMMQVAAAAIRQRLRFERGMMPPENAFRIRPSLGSTLRHYSFSNSRRRLVCARETGISLARLSFIFSM